MEALERELGLVLVAYELAGQELSDPHVVFEQETRPAELSDEQFQRLQAVEEKVALTLMAYQTSQE